MFANIEKYSILRSTPGGGRPWFSFGGVRCAGTRNMEQETTFNVLLQINSPTPTTAQLGLPRPATDSVTVADVFHYAFEARLLDPFLQANQEVDWFRVGVRLHSDSYLKSGETIVVNPRPHGSSALSNRPHFFYLPSKFQQFRIKIQPNAFSC